MLRLTRVHNNGSKNVEDNLKLDFKPISKKRRNRARSASLIVCIITACFPLVYSFVFREEEEPEYSSLLAITLGLCSVVLGTLVDRLCLIAEEWHHLSTRYDGSKWRMVKACFSGINWGPVILLFTTTVIMCIVLVFAGNALTGTTKSVLEALSYVLGGLGVGPLVMRLLSLNTQSYVHKTTLLEEGNSFAEGLAWWYYYNHLAIVLPKFRSTFPEGRIPTQDPTAKQLTINKLIVLIPHDCRTTDDLCEFDRNITSIPLEHEISEGKSMFSVYRFQSNTDKGKRLFAVQYAKEPLKVLDKWIDFTKNGKELLYYVELFYNALSTILNDRKHLKDKGSCILLPIIVNERDLLYSGGLIPIVFNLTKENVEQPVHEALDPSDLEAGGNVGGPRGDDTPPTTPILKRRESDLGEEGFFSQLSWIARQVWNYVKSHWRENLSELS